MLLYSDSRIKDNYILDLRADFKAYDGYQAKGFADTAVDELDHKADLSILRNNLFDSMRPGTIARICSGFYGSNQTCILERIERRCKLLRCR
jgi:hypothetical protein